MLEFTRLSSKSKTPTRMNLMSMKIITILGLGLLASSSARATVLYIEPGGTGVAYESDFSSGDRVYDNFSLPGGGSITTVDWSGVDINALTQTSITGGVSGFQLNFYSDVGGQPGLFLQSGTVFNSAGEISSGSINSSGYTVDNYSATLVAPFTATPGTQYFLSIVASDSAPDAWGWEDPLSGYGLFVPDNGTSSITGGLALTLEGTPLAPVPDGGKTVALLGMALAGLGLVLRGKKRVIQRLLIPPKAEG
jgi:hypothetical protein